MRRPRRTTQGVTVSLPAPIRGIMENTPVAAADPRGAEVCENFLPTDRGLKVRGGISRAAFVTDPVGALFSFIEPGSNALFAATANAVYDVSGLNPTTAPAPVISLMTSGDWSAQQVGVAGGNYIVAVNGSDLGQIYDGTNWHPHTDEAVNQISYDALTADFALGETLTGGTSSATAEILGVVQLTATTGTIKLGAITGTFQDNETITSASGSATSASTTSAASTVTVTGVATSALSHVWLYRQRLFFIEKDTLKAWYLPTAQVGGAAADISLAGIFRRGGSLLTGATWSLDSGDGIDDKAVFISTEGEVAVYSGSDPSTPADWQLEGRYDIGRPLGKKALMQAGGDLVIATDDGIVPLSQVIQKDPAALSLSAVTRPIQDTWSREVSSSDEMVQLVKWTKENMMCVVLPESTRMLTANLQTGAWASQSGWPADCAVEYGGSVYIGRANGRIYKLNDTGADDGSTFTARVCFAFTDMGDPAAYKVATMARAAFFATGEYTYKLGVATDYNPTFKAAPDAANVTTDAMVWDVSNWDEAVWGGGVADARVGVQELWRSVGGAGYTMAPTVQISSGSAIPLNVELARVELIIESGGRAS